VADARVGGGGKEDEPLLVSSPIHTALETDFLNVTVSLLCLSFTNQWVTHYHVPPYPSALENIVLRTSYLFTIFLRPFDSCNVLSLPFHRNAPLFLLSVYSYAVKRETNGSSETSVNIYQTTWRHISQDSILHSHHRDNLNFHMM
jgi:hypothetical protein